MNNNYLNEEKYQKTRKKLTMIAGISIVIAVVFLILTILSKGNVKGFFFTGTFLTGVMIPIPLFFIANARSISAFQAQSTMPVAKEGLEKIAPSVGVVAKEVAKGFNEANNNKNTN